jgi:hypothetical protein
MKMIKEIFFFTYSILSLGLICYLLSISSYPIPVILLILVLSTVILFGEYVYHVTKYIYSIKTTARHTRKQRKLKLKEEKTTMNGQAAQR